MDVFVLNIQRDKYARCFNGTLSRSLLIFLHCAHVRFIRRDSYSTYSYRLEWYISVFVKEWEGKCLCVVLQLAGKQSKFIYYGSHIKSNSNISFTPRDDPCYMHATFSMKWTLPPLVHFHDGGSSSSISFFSFNLFTWFYFVPQHFAWHCTKTVSHTHV